MSILNIEELNQRITDLRERFEIPPKFHIKDDFVKLIDYLSETGSYLYNAVITTTIQISIDLANHLSNKSNPHSVSKNQLGLSEVENTSDLNKPISTATRNALNNKVDNSRVLTDVPEHAVFTDTTYSNVSEFNNDVGYLSTESDPLFSAWDKSTGISIKESQISDLKSYSLFNHNHNGVYEVIDTTILREENIGETVQGYNSNTTIQGIITLASLGFTGDTNANYYVYDDSSVLKDSDSLSAVTPSNKIITQTDISDFGGGDMLKSIYDTNNNGKVDSAENADKVNGLTVETAVPTGAVFTDTTYTNVSELVNDVGYITKLSIGNNIEDSLIGSVLFIGNSGTLSQDNSKFFYDITNTRFGIGTATPLSKLHLGGTIGSLSTGLTFGDGDTGFYESSDDVLRLQTLGTDRVTVDANGNVGIGTGSPNAPLTVGQPTIGSTGSNVISVFKSPSSASNTLVRIEDPNSNKAIQIYQQGSESHIANDAGSTYYFSAGAGMGFQTWSSGWNTKMFITSTGNVGIGTTSPTSKLQIQGLGSTSSTTSLSITDSVGSSKLFVRDDGNIGIGTTNPLSKLHVYGPDGTEGTIQLGAYASVGAEYGSGAVILGANVKPKVGSAGMQYTTTNAVGGGQAIYMKYTSGITFHTLAGSVVGGSTYSSERMRINTDGNVGIGTTNPSQKLHIISTSAGVETFPLLIQNFDTTIGTKVGIAFSASTSSTRYSAIEGIQEDGSNRIGLGFLTGAGASITEKMRIDSYGNIGIGTISSTSRTHIKGSGVTSSTYALKIDDFNGTQNFYIRDDGAWSFKGGSVGLSDNGWSTSNVTTTKTLNADSVTLDQLADVVATLVEALKAKGIILA